MELKLILYVRVKRNHLFVLFWAFIDWPIYDTGFDASGECDGSTFRLRFPMPNQPIDTFQL